MSGNHAHRLFVLIGISLSAAGSAAAGELPAPERVATVEGITEYRLGNGLKVLLFPDASKPTVTVNITYFVGSRHEGYGETGMAHLLEHMVFKGTPRHPQIWKALQDHGAQFNGTTWLDRTNYFETLAASEENLEFALALEADRMVNSRIAREDLESEFSVVRNEFEMGENDPIRILSERVVSAAFLWHNYGKSTIGSREDIERVPIDRLQAFYRKYYQPDNAMLVVAGKFDEAKTLERINELFGAIPRPTRVLDKTYTVEPVQDGERYVRLERVGDVQAVTAVYHICAGAHEDMAAIDVLADVLDADQTGRLYKALVEPQLATRVSANAMSLYDPGIIEITAQVRTDKPLSEVRSKLVEVLDGLGQQEISEEEVERAKSKFAKDFDLLLNNSGRVGIALTEWAACGDWRLMFLHRDRIAAVTPADVKRVAAHYLKPSNRTIGEFTPTKSPDRTKVPETPDLVALLKDYRGRKELAAGEAFEATPESIEARTQRTQLPVGMKLALLPKKTRGSKVNVRLLIHYGDEQTLAGHVDALELIPAMLSKGTSKMTRRQIQDRLDKLKAELRFDGAGGGTGRRMMGGAGGGLGTIGLSVETVRKNLIPVLELVAHLLKDSTFPEKEFEKLKKQMLADLERQLSEPMAIAPIELRRRLMPYPPADVRYVPTLAERIDRIKAVDVEDLKRLYAELVGASHAEVAVVGDFDAAEVRSTLEAGLAEWKSGRPFKRIEMPYREAKPETLVLETPDKANALFAMGMNLAIRDDDAEYPALFMANYLLGGSPNSRLLNRIRQKEGLSYGVGASVTASPHEKSASFFAGGICAPQNAERSLACVHEEIETLLKAGVTQKELDDARKGYMEQFKVSLSEDGMLASMLARDLYLGRTMEFTRDQLRKIEALTVEDVQAALRKHLHPDKLVVVRAGDFRKKPEQTKAEAETSKSQVN